MLHLAWDSTSATDTSTTYQGCRLGNRPQGKELTLRISDSGRVGHVDSGMRITGPHMTGDILRSRVKRVGIDNAAPPASGPWKNTLGSRLSQHASCPDTRSRLIG